MPMTGASSPRTLSETMRRFRLEKLRAMKNCQARGSHARRPCASERMVSSAPAASVPGIWVVRSSTWFKPAGSFFRHGRRHSKTAGPIHQVRGRAASGLFETITDAVERLDHVKVVVDRFEFLTQPLDVAVDRAV